MFDEYRKGFRKAVAEHNDEWRKMKWYEKAGVYISGPIAYGIGKLTGFMEIMKEIRDAEKDKKD